ncbi:hypothetical protein FHX82_000039 [Amycolatopsis bartoniae]|uniref:YCII-related domain-containing protein n=1 Tax=Amycolatopsis bartoniae TaxID=941986 RepID=A0A8H9IW54_9PSEU|nr:YciI family protein [Amycolatopsis bartoniae]MBB2933019.1 hypothetical protein [Amycolatopsis bartoniae]TVT03393.1 hypothetical protein FNH07_25605 [Amycolatopsis bartoniae]GHF56428.1 hypothetical protein GCM10017566_31990 [Amycolatopsis bartoniae]
MAWFLVETRYAQDKYRDVRPRHREYLLELAEQGVVAVAGPLADDTGGVILVQADDEAALEKVLDADPYHVEGALESRTVREYKPVLGSWVR